MEHFENLWESAEELSNDNKQEIEEISFIISRQLQLLEIDPPETHEYLMGIALFNLCKLSKKLNINTFIALQKTITDEKSKLLEKISQ